MHLQLRCNFPRDQRLIVKSGYRVLKWPPTNELCKDDGRWRVMLWPPAVTRLMLMGIRVDIHPECCADGSHHQQ